MHWGREGSSISDSNSANILSPFPASIHHPRSTWTCSCKITSAGLSIPMVVTVAYPQETKQKFPYKECGPTSMQHSLRWHDSLVGSRYDWVANCIVQSSAYLLRGKFHWIQWTWPIEIPIICLSQLYQTTSSVLKGGKVICFAARLNASYPCCSSHGRWWEQYLCVALVARNSSDSEVEGQSTGCIEGVLRHTAKLRECYCHQQHRFLYF